MSIRFSNHTTFNYGNMRTPYRQNYNNRYGFYNQMFPFMGGYGMPMSQSFEVKTSTAQEIGTLLGTMEAASPGTMKGIFNWIGNKAAPAVWNAGKSLVNWIGGLFSKKSSEVAE